MPERLGGRKVWFRSLAQKPNSGPELSSLPWHPMLGTPVHNAIPCRRSCSSRSRSPASSVRIFSICTTISFSVVRGHLVPYLWMNDISGTAEVRDDWYGANAESFENHACTIVAKRWKHEDISRSQVLEAFRMTEPAAERQQPSQSQATWSICSRRFRSGPSPTTVKRAKSLRKRGAAARKARSQALPGNQAANENQLKFGPRLRAA